MFYPRFLISSSKCLAGMSLLPNVLSNLKRIAVGVFPVLSLAILAKANLCYHGFLPV